MAAVGVTVAVTPGFTVTDVDTTVFTPHEVTV